MTDERAAVNSKLLHQTLFLSPSCLSESRELSAVVPGEEFDNRQGHWLPATFLFFGYILAARWWMGVSFLHFKRWIGNLILGPLCMLNSLILAVFCPSACHTFNIYLCLLFPPPCLLCIILFIRSCFLIPDVSYFPSLARAVAFHSLLDVSLLPIFFFSLSHSQFLFIYLFFGPFTLCSRWDFHWLKPDVACTFVSSWPSAAHKDESPAGLSYQSALLPHPSLAVGSKMKRAPDWSCLG